MKLFNLFWKKVEYYSVRVKCTNCFFTGTISIPKGKTTSQVSCPRCNTKWLLVREEY